MRILGGVAVAALRVRLSFCPSASLVHYAKTFERN